MGDERILYDFDEDSFVEVCRDVHGVRIELIEFTGVRARDVDELLVALRARLVERFEEQPGLRRIVAWTDAAWLAQHDAGEYDEVREAVEQGLLRMQNP